MSEWVTMWVRRRRVGWGSHHSVMSCVHRARGAADSTVWHWYIQNHEVEKRFYLFSTLLEYLGDIQLTRLLSNCATKNISRTHYTICTIT